MTRTRAAALGLLLLAAPALAQPPAPKQPSAKASIDQLLSELVDAKKKKADAEKVEAATVKAIEAAVKELHDKLKKAGIDVGPAPVPPPKPKVDPKPAPKPDDPPAPVVTGGLRVLFVYESSAALTREQQAVIYSPAVAEYLNRKCAKSAAGHPEWRRWDKDVALSAKESPTMRDLWAATKPKLGTLPQLLIVNDKAGQLYALPATEAETLALLESYGGK
jgi:hypothetical protein